MIVKYEIDDIKFSGPIWLLYDKASSLEVDLLEISISRIAKDFIYHQGSSSMVGVEEYSEFIFYLSMILLLKSEAVLPRPKRMDDEDIPLPIVLPLERELFKKIGLRFREMNCYASLIGRIPDLEESISLSDAGMEVNLNLYEIATIYKNICDRLIDNSTGGTMPLKMLIKRVEEEMNSIIPRLYEDKSVLFRELISGYLARIDIIIAFLAILELFRIGVINLRQARVFGDIEITLQRKNG